MDFANKLGSTCIEIENGGHLNAEFGYTQFPLLLDEIISAQGGTP